jgi:hypothetical protein
VSSRVLRIVAVAALVAVTATGVWMARAGPGHTSALGAGLAGVSCTSAAACVAVGSRTNGSDVESPVSAAWNGSGWSLSSMPSPTGTSNSALEGVSCVARDACMGVGHREIPSRGLSGTASEGAPLAETWDGSAWDVLSLQAPPAARDSDLHAVSCAGRTCVAVGDGESRAGRELTFSELWDGSNWRLSITPNPSAADDSFLQAVSCASPVSCVAVGSFEYEVREVSTRTAPLIERWDGTHWRIERPPDTAGSQGAALQGVDCRSPQRCTAVGWEQLAGGAYGPFAVGWNGTAWTREPVPAFPGSPDTELNAVACPRDDSCTAVGYTQQRSGAALLGLTWNGSTWETQQMPQLRGAADTALNAVDCARSGACVAVGAYRTQSLLQRALTATWNGTRWTVVPMPASPPTG